MTQNLLDSVNYKLRPAEKALVKWAADLEKLNTDIKNAKESGKGINKDQLKELEQRKLLLNKSITAKNDEVAQLKAEKKSIMAATPGLLDDDPMERLKANPQPSSPKSPVDATPKAAPASSPKARPAHPTYGLVRSALKAHDEKPGVSPAVKSAATTTATVETAERKGPPPPKPPMNRKVKLQPAINDSRPLPALPIEENVSTQQPSVSSPKTKINPVMGRLPDNPNSNAVQGADITHEAKAVMEKGRQQQPKNGVNPVMGKLPVINRDIGSPPPVPSREGRGVTQDAKAKIGEVRAEHATIDPKARSLPTPK